MTVLVDDYFFAPGVEMMPKEALARLQLERFQWSVAHAYANVPLYRARMDAAGVRPDDIRFLEDIGRLPFTTKNDLRETYPFGLFAVPRREVARIHASSGTTGKSIVLGYTLEDVAVWADLVARCIACVGGRPGDLLHNAYNYGLFTGGIGFHYGAERLGCLVVPVSGGNTERQLQLIQDFEPQILACTPSYALRIAEVAQEQGIDLSTSSLRVGCFGAEPWSESMRTELEARLGITSGDFWGLSEAVGPGVACSCSSQDGVHVWEDCFLIEVIDPLTGERLPEGETGEIVISTLTKQAQPMIRYRTRDVSRVIPEPCRCGRTHRRLQRVSGRSDDMLIIRGVNVFPSQVEAVLVGNPGTEPHYELVVSEDGAMPRLTVRVEAARSAGEDAYPAVAMQVAQRIKSSIGLSCTVEVTKPGELPRSEGKAVRVRDLRKH